MTARPRNSGSGQPELPAMELRRVRVRRDGYDASGTYWGAGPDAFIATLQDGAQDITVRATTITEARTKVAAELARAPGAPPASLREPLGGASPNKTRSEIVWRDPVSTLVVRLRITHSRDYLGMGQDHIEVETLAPKKAALPISDTGYRSHFMSPLELADASGPVTFVTAWLDREAHSKDWQKRQTVRAQGDLFQWADANTEVGKRNPITKAKRPMVDPAQRRSKRRDPA